jgi:phosphoglycolate phosphatase
VFDLDGTLIDTAPDLIGSLNGVLAEQGLPPVALADARHLVGQGAKAMIERGFALAGAALPAAKYRPCSSASSNLPRPHRPGERDVR